MALIIGFREIDRRVAQRSVHGLSVFDIAVLPTCMYVCYSLNKVETMRRVVKA